MSCAALISPEAPFHSRTTGGLRTAGRPLASHRSSVGPPCCSPAESGARPVSWGLSGDALRYHILGHKGDFPAIHGPGKRLSVPRAKA